MAETNVDTTKQYVDLHACAIGCFGGRRAALIQQSTAVKGHCIQLPVR